jgi:hypothetical protein
MSCDLVRRIGIVLGAILVARVGDHLPLPGVGMPRGGSSSSTKGSAPTLYFACRIA